ncbi:GGDEF domain-containing protein [Haloactinopolyspora sp.]|uniref:GGDEF domain-containing protein n=1 Tax=Haloactinopolyspora sp. TaxID=1966353 RepID=UPI002610051A|nr:GGDEF domain-containing protein [Haloactinopolyspora sp.]
MKPVWRRSLDREADRSRRFPPPDQGRLRVEARDDPITGLVAWTNFYPALPEMLATECRARRTVGLAIGDVDNLKAYVEDANSVDVESFGHLAGNALMRRLGTVARCWLHEAGPNHACMATFGGDELVLVAETGSGREFDDDVNSLRDALCTALPCTVSFSTAVVTADHAPPGAGAERWREFTTHAIARVDRALFNHKKARRDDPDLIPAGFVAPATLSTRV